MARPAGKATCEGLAHNTHLFALPYLSHEGVAGQTLQAKAEAQRQVAVAQAALSAAEAASARIRRAARHRAAGPPAGLGDDHVPPAGTRRCRGCPTDGIGAGRTALERRIGDVQGQNEEYKGRLATMDADQLDYARREGEVAALRQQFQNQAALIARISTRPYSEQLRGTAMSRGHYIHEPGSDPT